MRIHDLLYLSVPLHPMRKVPASIEIVIFSYRFVDVVSLFAGKYSDLSRSHKRKTEKVYFLTIIIPPCGDEA